MDVYIETFRYLFGTFFCYAGFMHLKNPKFFNKLIPDFLPKQIVNYIFGVIEIMLGIGLFFNRTLENASLGVLVLLTLLLPIHLWDFSKVKPAVGSKKMAITRILVQFLLMYLAYLMYIIS